MRTRVKPVCLLTFLAICFTPSTALACKAEFYKGLVTASEAKGFVGCYYSKRKKEKLRKKAADFCENKGYAKEKTTIYDYADCGKRLTNRCGTARFICRK